MIIIQQQTNNQSLGSLYVSSPFTLNIVNPTSVTITGGNLKVNNIPVTIFPATINPTDLLTVEITNSTNIATTTYAILTTTESNQYIISSTTITDSTHYHRTDSLNIGPFDYLTYPNGYTVYPYPADNKITVLQPNGTLTEILPSSYTLSTDSYPTDTSRFLVFVANYINDSIYVFNSTNTIVGRISLTTGARPSYLVDSPANDKVIVTQTGLNSIVVIDRSFGNIINTITVGTKPMGITIDNIGNIWVANFGSNNVSVISSIDYSLLATIPVGQGPIEIITDNNGNIWVSNSKDNTVSVIDYIAHTVITTVTVGTNPWGLCSVGLYVYVSNSYSDNISKIDISTYSIVNTITTNTVPYSITSNNTTSFYVACTDSSTIQYFVNDTLVSTTNVPAYPFGVVIDSRGHLWIPDYYDNLPSRTYQKSQTPDSFSFLSIRDAHKLTSYTSNTVTISGLDEPSIASIPPIAETYITKNGNNVGFSTNVVNGDILSVTVTTSNVYDDSVSTELTVGNWSAIYTVTVESHLTNIPSYRFTTITNANPNTLYSSNTVNIYRISSDISIPVTVSAGTIIKNNISVGMSTTVVLGDTIQLQLTSSPIDNTPVFANVTIGEITDVFTVITGGANVFNGTPVYDLGTLINQDPNIVEYSNTIVINNLVLDGALQPIPITIVVDPYTNTQIIKNGVPVGQTVQVTDGDTIQLTGYSPLYMGYTRIINLYMGSWIIPWTISTTPDLIPLPFIWQDVFNIPPGTTIRSNQSLVEGMTPGYSITVNVPYGTLYVNNVPSNTIQYGDLVALQLKEKPPYSATRHYKVSAGGQVSNNINIPDTGIISIWNVTASKLTYPVHWESNNLPSIPRVDPFQRVIGSTMLSVNTTTFVRYASQFAHSAVTVLNSNHTITSIQHLVNTSFDQYKGSNIQEVSTNYVHINSVGNVVYSIPTNFVYVPESFVRSVDVSYTNVLSVTQHPVISVSFTKSKQTANTVARLFTKSKQTTNTVARLFTKSKQTTNTVTHLFTKSKQTANTVNLSFTKSKQTANTVTHLFTKSTSAVHVVNLSFIKSFVVGYDITTQWVLSNNTSYNFDNTGPVYYDYNVFDVHPASHPGTFTTSAAAISAGHNAGYANVSSMKVTDNRYVWVVPAQDCLIFTPPPPGALQPVYGYQHGG